MPSTQPRTSTKADPITEAMRAPRCGHKYGRKCGLQIHTWTVARPRQHRVFSYLPSPTTRPPRGNLKGWVRVVGLGLIWVRVLAGAGGMGSVDRRSRVMQMKSDQGEVTA